MCVFFAIIDALFRIVYISIVYLFMPFYLFVFLLYIINMIFAWGVPLGSC